MSRPKNMNRSTWLSLQVVLLGLLLFTTLPAVKASYPMVVKVQDDMERCLTFTIPEDEDVHIVVLPLPDEDLIQEDDALVAWYVHQVNKLHAQRDQYEPLAKHLPDAPPADIAKLQSEFFQRHHDSARKSPLEVHLTVSGAETEETNHKFRPVHLKTSYFDPFVFNYVRELTGTHDKKIKWEDLALLNYELCMEYNDRGTVRTNEEDDQIQVILLLIMDGDKYPIDHVDAETEEAKFHKDQHLTPLEETLDESIEAANNVLREMRYMEKREVRMRKTADSINTRIRWFSYLSMSVLLAVTYIQVTYLKRYFRKKKLL